MAGLHIARFLRYAGAGGAKVSSGSEEERTPEDPRRRSADCFKEDLTVFAANPVDAQHRVRWRSLIRTDNPT